MALELLDACRVADDRPNPWCLIAFASRETARLMERLTESWGQGVTCLTRKNQDEGDHGIPHGEASLIQQCSETRVWWGGGEYLDPFLVLEALRHGCLPLQCVPKRATTRWRLAFLRAFRHFTLAIPERAHPPDVETGTGRENRRRAIDPPGRKHGARPGADHSFSQINDMNIKSLFRLPWKTEGRCSARCAGISRTAGGRWPSSCR